MRDITIGLADSIWQELDAFAQETRIPHDIIAQRAIAVYFQSRTHLREANAWREIGTRIQRDGAEAILRDAWDDREGPR